MAKKVEKTRETSVEKPPYGSFKSFRAFVDTLGNTVVPDHLDRSMMTKMSGVTQSEIFSAFRFFGLLGKEDATTTKLRVLVESFGSDKWAPTLAKYATEAYAEILGNLNLKSGTAKQVRDRFKSAAAIDGQMLSRTLRFYLATLKEAKIEHSPHFKDATKGLTPKKKTRPKPKSKKPGDDGNGDDGDNDEPPPKGARRWPLYFKGKPDGALIVPKDLTLADCKVIEMQLAVLKAYTGEEVR